MVLAPLLQQLHHLRHYSWKVGEAPGHPDYRQSCPGGESQTPRAHLSFEIDNATVVVVGWDSRGPFGTEIELTQWEEILFSFRDSSCCSPASGRVIF